MRYSAKIWIANMLFSNDFNNEYVVYVVLQLIDTMPANVVYVV